jgi:hypothetical protein
MVTAFPGQHPPASRHENRLLRTGQAADVPVHGNFDCIPEPKMSVFILHRRLFQQETKMRNLIIAACCAALMGSTSVAFAQTPAPAAAPDATKADTSASSTTKMKKKSSKKSAMKSGDTKSDTSTKDAK